MTVIVDRRRARTAARSTSRQRSRATRELRDRRAPAAGHVPRHGRPLDCLDRYDRRREAARRREDVQELHRRRVGGRRVRRDVRDDQPGDRRDARRLPELRRRRRRPRRRGREGGLRGVAPRARRPSAATILFRFAHLLRRAQGRADRADDARDGEGARRGGRRRPGSDRHELLHGRRGPAPLRPDDAVASCATSST